MLILLMESWESLQLLGPSFLVGSEWNVQERRFGALPFIYGTLVTSALSILIAVPLGVGAAACLAEYIQTGCPTPWPSSGWCR